MHQTAVQNVREVIVVNDGSTDDTGKNVLEWKENSGGPFPVILVELKENMGVSAARNRGVKQSIGDYIAFLDADDEWKPEKLKTQLDVLQRYPKIKALGSGWDQLNLRPGKKIITSSEYSLYRMDVKTELIYFWPPVPSLIAERNVFLGTGGFRENMRYAEDSDLLCRLAERGSLYYVDEELILVGHGKNPFGEKGLSAKLSCMHKGFKTTIRGCFRRGSINIIEYRLFLLLEEIKYIRRILLSAGIKKDRAGFDTK